MYHVEYYILTGMSISEKCIIYRNFFLYLSSKNHPPATHSLGISALSIHSK
uniref:Uncharacterized protein n=1 Tax=Anguilla anguilla TaxID=7936 RepID=A0A0E9PSR2_ANGAN